MTEEKSLIYVAAYPKSGSTFATRLIGDVLNSPTGGSTPKLDDTEPATEGKNRPGAYMVRKGHYVVRNNPNDLRTVPGAHIINMTALKDNARVICIFRDPRDIAVSGAFYWNTQNVAQFLQDMKDGKNHVRLCGNWSRYVKRWMAYCRNDDRVIAFDFADLVLNPYDSMVYLCNWLGVELDDTQNVRIGAAIERQSFDATQKRIHKKGDRMPLGKKQNLKLLRSGKVGEWRNCFTGEMNKNAWAWFGPEMRKLQYELD